MKLPDVNVLLYALDSDSPRHAAARPWLESVLSGAETVGFAWSVLLGVLRLSTRATIFERPFAPDAALDVVDGWLARPNAVVLHPGTKHSTVLRGLLAGTGSAGNLVTDAHLAALAIEHGGTVCSSDADFSRFAGLRWEDPLRV